MRKTLWENSWEKKIPVPTSQALNSLENLKEISKKSQTILMFFGKEISGESSLRIIGEIDLGNTKEEMLT